MAHLEHETSSVRTWVIIFLLLLAVAYQGALAFYLIGDRGQPDWDYRPVKDVPGESPYAVYEYFPFPQHVMGKESDYPPINEDTPLEGGWEKRFFPPPKPNAMVNK